VSPGWVSGRLVRWVPRWGEGQSGCRHTSAPDCTLVPACRLQKGGRQARPWGRTAGL